VPDDDQLDKATSLESKGYNIWRRLRWSEKPATNLFPDAAIPGRIPDVFLATLVMTPTSYFFANLLRARTRDACRKARAFKLP
jgi:hypothetical protein